jgi:hypothetical protein
MIHRTARNGYVDGGMNTVVRGVYVVVSTEEQEGVRRPSYAVRRRKFP